MGDEVWQRERKNKTGWWSVAKRKEKEDWVMKCGNEKGKGRIRDENTSMLFYGYNEYRDQFVYPISPLSSIYFATVTVIYKTMCLVTCNRFSIWPS
jgi:hypothetical protein